MSAVKHELDMTKGSIFKNTFRFAVPLMLANVLQLLYNAADLVVVSRWAGNDAMASVGSTGALTNLLINIFVGVSLGAGVVVSRRYGAGDDEGLSKAVHTSVFLGIIAGVCSLLAGLFLSKPLLMLMGTPEGKVLDGAVLYMKIIFIGTPAVMVYNFGAAVMRAVGDTKRPLYILSLSGIVNVILNLVLVIGFGMGVEGVAIATAVSNYLSMFMVLYALTGADSAYRLNLKEIKIHNKEIKEILKIGLPAGLQGSVFSLSNTVIQSAINSFGAVAMSGSAAAANIEGFVYTAMNSFYQATVTSVSQNYGAKQEKRIYKSIYVSMVCVVTVGIILGGLGVVFSRELLGIYITDSPQAIEFGRIRMILTGLPYFLCGIMEVMTGALRGLGYSLVTAINSLIGACGFRMLWIFVVLPMKRVPQILFMSWSLSWSVVILMHVICFILVHKKAIMKMYNE